MENQNKNQTTIQLDEDQRKELIKLEKTIKDKAIAIRIRIILGLDKGYSQKELAEILLLDESTIIDWKNKFINRKNDKDWLERNFVGYTGKLSVEQEKQVEQFVVDNIITDCKLVLDYIKKEFHQNYSVNGIHSLLHRLNFSYKETVIFPAKLDIQKQELFIEEYKDLKANLKEKEKILFLDAVHPTHNTKTVKCWIKKGQNKFIKTNTGRNRLNINGALDLQETEVVTHFDETVNSQTTIKLLDKIQEKYSDYEKIYLICDNAKYYKSKLIKEYLEKNDKLQIKFLPAYSPNLNLIERLWKYFRKKGIGTKYREKFKEFERDIYAFFDNLKTSKKELKRFIGDKMHLIQVQQNSIKTGKSI